jgi:hypothetical protein
MRLFHLIFVSLLLAALSVSTLAGNRSGSTPSATPVLPQQFAGWQVTGAIKTSADPAVADPVNASVLKEYGFSSFESATYTRDDGRQLTLKAIRFPDASGAYGAFTFYKTPPMLIEKIGDQAGSLNERILFYRGNILVDAVFQQLSAMSAAELRELSDDLPLAKGNTQSLPGLPAYLPKPSYVKNSAKYVLGPVTLDKVGAPIPADLVDFAAGAEVVLGNYTTSGGGATLMLIAYPTPQIAAEHLRRIEAAHPPGPQSDATPPLTNAAFFDKRTGPILVIATGALSSEEGKFLLASVNYDANVTWNENTYLTKRDNLANLLVNIIYLCGIIIGFALVAGLAFGGLRVFIRRVFLERFFGEKDEVRFIALHLSDGELHSPPASANSSIKTI